MLVIVLVVQNVKR